jgi:hypothetical protein
MSFGCFSQSLELVDFFLKRRDAFLQIGCALREGLDLARFNLAVPWNLGSRMDGI